MRLPRLLEFDMRSVNCDQYAGAECVDQRNDAPRSYIGDDELHLRERPNDRHIQNQGHALCLPWRQTRAAESSKRSARASLRCDSGALNEMNVDAALRTCFER